MTLTLSDIREMFSRQDYSRGMAYFQDGRVSSMEYNTDGTQEIVKCTVRGTANYQVSFREVDQGFFRIYCSCPRFLDSGHCKHVVAAMISFVKAPPAETAAHSDRYARDLLQHYLEKAQQSCSTTPGSVRLVPQLQDSYLGRYEYPSFSFRVGREKLYVVKNIREFLSNVDAGKTTVYGKQLTLDHNMSQFDDQSQQIIRLLMNEYGQFRSIGGRGRQEDWYDMRNYQKNEITLTGDAFDRWFSLFRGTHMAFAAGGSILFTEEDPQVGICLNKQTAAAELEIKTETDYHFFGSRNNLYALGGNTLTRCSAEFQEKVYPLLSQERDFLRLSYQDLPVFCSCVLPEIADLVDVEDPEMLLQEYLPEECTPCFFFDLDQETLLLKLKFRYGQTELSQDTDPAAAAQIKRDVKTENAATALAKQHFLPRGNQYALAGEDAVYTFLTESLDDFRAVGEVFVSDRLREKRIQPATAGVGISVSDGLLSLTLDTGGFPPEELEALYHSLLQRRKYHRLPDGRYLPLDGSSYEKLAEMSHMLQLSKRDLSKGTVTLPAFRGLYLDDILSNNESIQVRRDQQFRSMIRNFKSVPESDYILPQNLESVLRPYQKTGFQWLKTLEHYSFGGILADEMGLGKTLQIIAYLATVPREAVGHPSLVVCPTSLILNWGEELERFAPQLSFTLIFGNASQRKALRDAGGDRDVWVTSYELLRQDLSDYTPLEFYACILDEAQHIKNQTTLISRAVKQISSRQRFVLTGTPVENRLSELWNLFDFLMSGYLFSSSAFREKLEKPILKSKNPEAAAQLRRLVQPFLLRRLKKDVLKELPPKEDHVRRIPLSEQEQKTYYACVHALQAELGEDQGKLQILAALTRLRQICCDPNLCFENYDGATSKLDACIELCEAMVENGHQILLFSQFTTMLDRIRSRLDAAHISSFTLQGSTPKETRAKLVKEFNAGGASVFLISLKAGGTGLNLTAADVVIHYDPWWNQAAQDQATDRAHRIGQQAHVQVYRFIAKDTIEEKILDLQDRKAALMDTIAGSGDGGILNMTKEELMELLDYCPA